MAETYRIWRTPSTFSGWGMTTTTTSPPWKNVFEGCELANVQGFQKTDERLRDIVREGKFVLSMFSECPDMDFVLNELKWRHYLVYWSALYAAKNTRSEIKNYAECGVCDGMGIFFVLNAAKNAGGISKAYLYDAWDEMKPELLLPTEEESSGDYAYLSIKQTRKNLDEYRGDVVFNRGYIPDSFATSENPENIVWLHIDLNSALPTESALSYFYDRLEIGGVVLLDDYGWLAYADTKRVTDKFFKDKKDAELLQLPTGQAIVFKR
jgi:hypothetical protein